MADLLLVPAFILMAGALLVALSPSWLRSPLVLLTPLLGLFAIFQIPDGASYSIHFLGYDIALIAGGPLRKLFAGAFAIMAFAAGLFSMQRARGWELAAGLGSAGGAIGVAFAGDLIALFLFWEILALCSFLLIWSGGTERALRAGIRYIVLHLLRGLLLKLGIEEVLLGTGSIAVRPLSLDEPGMWLLLAAILISAAAPPVSFWVADGYPESNARSNVWLSGFTTTTAVLALLLLFPGASVLVGIGVWMIFYGILYALLENNVRRALSYSIINQAGFMVCAIGIGTEAALNGAVALAIVSMFAMGILFMSAGAVEEITGERRYSSLGGLFRGMPITAICGTIGALALSAFPLTTGFVANSLLRSGAGESPAIGTLLLLGAGGVFLHVGLRFPWTLFFRKDVETSASEAPWNMRAALILLSVICIGVGIFPGLLLAALPFPIGASPYAVVPLFVQLLVLLLAGALFFSIFPKLKQVTTLGWDWDWFYRRLGVGSILRLTAWGVSGWERLNRGPGDRARTLMIRFFRTHGPQGPLARSWPTGSMVLWVGVMLGAYLIFSLL